MSCWETDCCEKCKLITDLIMHGDLSPKPGWIRSSFHPAMKDEELIFIIDAIKQVAVHHPEWGKDYLYNKHTNEFIYKKDEGAHKDEMVRGWFEIGE